MQVGYFVHSFTSFIWSWHHFLPFIIIIPFIIIGPVTEALHAFFFFGGGSQLVGS